MQCAVIIMAYSPTPSKSEVASYEQCLVVLGNHPLLLVCPETLDISLYTELAAKCGGRVKAVRFPDACFRSVSTYNRMMLTPEFYRRFLEYEYILIYQLDAWVFRDELEFWCHKGYAYVGAPFFTDRGELLPFAGNGGFSLRRVRTFLDIFDTVHVVTDWNYRFFCAKFPAKNPFRAFLKQVLHAFCMLICRADRRFYCTHMPGNEDMLYARALSLMGERNVASPEEAALFASERFPDILYGDATKYSPFGCHAYEKYGKKFLRM